MREDWNNVKWITIHKVSIITCKFLGVFFLHANSCNSFKYVDRFWFFFCFFRESHSFVNPTKHWVPLKDHSPRYFLQFLQPRYNSSNFYTGYNIALDILLHWICYYIGYIITLDMLLHWIYYYTGFHIHVDGAIGFKQEVVWRKIKIKKKNMRENYFLICLSQTELCWNMWHDTRNHLTQLCQMFTVKLYAILRASTTCILVAQYCFYIRASWFNYRPILFIQIYEIIITKNN